MEELSISGDFIFDCLILLNINFGIQFQVHSPRTNLSNKMIIY